MDEPAALELRLSCPKGAILWAGRRWNIESVALGESGLLEKHSNRSLQEIMSRSLRFSGNRYIQSSTKSD